MLKLTNYIVHDLFWQGTGKRVSDVGVTAPVPPTHLRNNSDTTPRLVRLKSEKPRGKTGEDTLLHADYHYLA